MSLQWVVCALLACAWVTAVIARADTSEQAPAPRPQEGIILPEPGPRGAVTPRVPSGSRDTSQQPPGQKPAEEGLAQPTPAAAAATLVGNETCLTCHEEQQQGYGETMHGRSDHPRSPAAKQGCETCHGPGSMHADDPETPGLIRGFVDDPPQEANETCTTCHSRGTHALWDGSSHDSRNVACVACHSVHDFKSKESQLKTAREMDTCASCHRDKVAKVDRSGHMPVAEGKMNCSTCHNPHGSTSVRLLRVGESVGDLCGSCHADKRGPFLWEHAPTRDGCTTCHDPHGSANERMLITKAPILCQRCHVMTRHPSTIYDAGLIGSGASPSVRVFARSCVLCHSTIHGSNHPSGQRFIR